MTYVHARMQTQRVTRRPAGSVGVLLQLFVQPGWAPMAACMSAAAVVLDPATHGRIVLRIGVSTVHARVRAVTRRPVFLVF